MQKNKDEVRVLKRAIEILEVLRIEKEPQSLAFLHQTLGLSKTTMARILGTLEAEGFVERDSTLRRYTLGRKFFYYGYAVSERLTGKQVMAPVLQRIRNACSETVYVYILNNNCRLCVDYLPGKNAVRVMTYLGEESPLYAGAAGKVILAYFTKEELEKYFKETELIPLTPYTIVDRELLEQDLRLIRERGYAVSSGEKTLGVISVSAPLKDEKGRVRASISIAAPIDRQSEISTYAKLVTEGAKEINDHVSIRL